MIFLFFVLIQNLLAKVAVAPPAPPINDICVADLNQSLKTCVSFCQGLACHDCAKRYEEAFETCLFAPSSTKDILILHKSRAFKFNTLSGMHTELNWDIPDGNQHYLGCSFMWNNKMILTGGRGGPGDYEVYRHVSEVYDCGIRALEITLPIKFQRHSCTKMTENKALLCFPDSATDQCYIFSSDGFQITAPSNHPHKWAANLNQIGGKYVTVGSRENVSHAESFNGETWTDHGRFAWEPDEFSEIGSFTINDKLYILGGWSGDDTYGDSMSFVYQGYFHPLDSSVLVWKKLNTSLAVRKSGFRSITVENTAFIIGGINGPKFTEKWTFSGEDVKQKELFYPIDDYFGYPELLIIDKNFCSGI